MPGGRKWNKTPRPLSEEDKVFIKLVHEAKIPRVRAFAIAYPNHKHVMRYMDVVKNREDLAVRQRAAELLKQATKTKLQTQRIQGALVTYQNKMDMFSELAVDTAIDLLENARSEKVKADLAIEGMRHKVGTPVQKVAVKEEKTVILTFGDAPKDRDVVEGEVVN